MCIVPCARVFADETSFCTYHTELSVGRQPLFTAKSTQACTESQMSDGKNVTDYSGMVQSYGMFYTLLSDRVQ